MQEPDRDTHAECSPQRYQYRVQQQRRYKLQVRPKSRRQRWWPSTGGRRLPGANPSIREKQCRVATTGNGYSRMWSVDGYDADKDTGDVCGRGHNGDEYNESKRAGET